MNKKLKIAIILLIVGVLLVVLCPSVSLMLPLSIIGVLLSIASLVLNHLSRKESNEKKGVSTICNIFGMLVLIFCLLEVLGTIMMTNPDLNEPICQREDMVGECVDQGKGISKCKYMKNVEIPCNNDALEDSQIK